MSRTYKDIKRYKRRAESKASWETRYDVYEYYGVVYSYPDYNETTKTVLRTKYLKKAGVLTKKRKNDYSKDHWYRSTPSWWTHLFMTRPQRRKGRVWECEVVKSQVIALEEADPPSVGKKPHIYYW